MKKTIQGTDKDFNKWVDGMIEKAIREYDRAEARKKKLANKKSASEYRSAALCAASRCDLN